MALVNKGNKVINEQTEAAFFIMDRELFLGIDKKQKVVLCIERGWWYPKKSSGHSNFENFICKVLNTNKIISGDVNRLIKYELFKLPS